ncbi:MAG: hypothetical protein ACYC8V_00320 [Caulobacteraceae bacterium]
MTATTRFCGRQLKCDQDGGGALDGADRSEEIDGGLACWTAGGATTGAGAITGFGTAGAACAEAAGAGGGAGAMALAFTPALSALSAGALGEERALDRRAGRRCCAKRAGAVVALAVTTGAAETGAAVIFVFKEGAVLTGLGEGPCAN